MLIVLNDNEMSISKNVGAISKYLNQIITNPLYNRVRAEVERQLTKFPRLRRLATSSLEGMKHLLIPGILFEEMGFRYFGPVDGHDVIGLVKTLKKILAINDCSLLHIVTQKGKGCSFAEQDAEKGHGVVPFDVKTGEKIKSPNEQKKQGKAYTKAFVDALIRVARERQDVVAITAAMPTGTGLIDFQKEFPDRFYDVGIAEQHAVTFAGALAKGGLKPVCAIYSTFLQRAHDQIIHDVALQRQPLILAMDRAGLVGADGATHNGVFDISFLGHIPGTVIAAPVNEAEIEHMLRLAMAYPDVFAFRYPRGNVTEKMEAIPFRSFRIGEGEIVREGADAAILALGTMLETSLDVADRLKKEGIDVRVVHMRFVKPLDSGILLDCANRHMPIFTLEEHVFTGGMGSKVLEFFERENRSFVPVHRFALPDHFIEHGTRELLLDQFGLSPEKIAKTVAERLAAGQPFYPAHQS
ncbi:MAG: 1-deoxy-D-xylulose-5-phosphate synthase [Omnitrophica bacterium GWA2_52_8]|nr:MAG: 1-deoxy-D-xylulose-5-phosphate synthase [Omnitrophica bacterium GWA2_52_8]